MTQDELLYLRRACLVHAVKLGLTELKCAIEGLGTAYTDSVFDVGDITVCDIKQVLDKASDNLDTVYDLAISYLPDEVYTETIIQSFNDGPDESASFIDSTGLEKIFKELSGNLFCKSRADLYFHLAGGSHEKVDGVIRMNEVITYNQRKRGIKVENKDLDSPGNGYLTMVVFLLLTVGCTAITLRRNLRISG